MSKLTKLIEQILYYCILYFQTRIIVRGDEWSIKSFNCSQILPLLDLLAKFKRVLPCSCSPNFCVARKLAKQIFHFCSCSQKNRSARHARECSQRPFVTPIVDNHFLQKNHKMFRLPKVTPASAQYHALFFPLWQTKNHSENILNQ